MRNQEINNIQKRRVSFSNNLRKKSRDREEVDDVVVLEPEIPPEDSPEDEASPVRETFHEQARRKHSIYSFTSDLPENALRVRAFFQRIAIALWNQADSFWAKVLSWTVLGGGIYLMLLTILGLELMGPRGEVFSLLAMLVCAHLVGLLVQRFLKLPSLLGMLIVGCVFRNFNIYNPEKSQYNATTKTFKQLATTVGMIKAGMRLVPDAIYVALHCHHGLRLAGLGMVPSFLEAMVTTVIAYWALGYPPVWAVCLGFLLCPNSPSVITPPMAELMEQGYGEEKHIGVLVHGAAGLDVAFSVSIFDICLAMLFHGRNLHPAHMVGHGSLDVLADVVGGFLIGVVAGLLPFQDNELAVWKRWAALMAGGMIAIVSGPRVGLPGTGPLSCICTAFVAAMLWKLQAPLSCKRTVNSIMQGAWVVLCPMLFAFTGADVDIEFVEFKSWCWMILIVIVTVVMRLLGCFLVLWGSEFNVKEMLFIGLIFQGKATNQAALAPQILYAAVNVSNLENFPDDKVRGHQAVAMGAMSILLCTPIAHLGAKLCGPYLLKQKQTKPLEENSVPEQSV